MYPVLIIIIGTLLFVGAVGFILVIVYKNQGPPSVFPKSAKVFKITAMKDGKNRLDDIENKEGP